MKIGIVLVTFNRLNDLKKVLIEYEEQEKKPEYILVVNNSSTDGTNEFLENWKNEKSYLKKYVINLEKNSGGSGGFYRGLKEAINLNSDWIWVSDDDAYPERNALSEIERFYKNHENNNIAALCTSVINNGQVDLTHRKRIIKKPITIEQRVVEEKEYKKEYFEIDLFSYVGTMISKEFLKSVGLPEKDYFIYYDDTEHSLRIKNSGKILCIPKAKVNHNVNRTSDDGTLTWRNYYMIRNRLLFYKKHFSKRYFYYTSFDILFKEFSKRKDKEERLLVKSAINDAKNNKKGLDCKYKPGWSLR